MICSSLLKVSRSHVCGSSILEWHFWDPHDHEALVLQEMIGNSANGGEACTV